MTNVVVRVVRAAKFAGFLALALAASACANRPNDPQAGGSAPPGSQQDFVVNVGDRVLPGSLNGKEKAENPFRWLMPGECGAL